MRFSTRPLSQWINWVLKTARGIVGSATFGRLTSAQLTKILSDGTGSKRAYTCIWTKSSWLKMSGTSVSATVPSSSMDCSLHMCQRTNFTLMLSWIRPQIRTGLSHIHLIQQMLTKSSTLERSFYALRWHQCLKCLSFRLERIWLLATLSNLASTTTSRQLLKILETSYEGFCLEKNQWMHSKLEPTP